MKLLLTGANGYIGRRLLVDLLDEGHQVFALLRRSISFNLTEEQQSHFHVIYGDLLDKKTLETIPPDLDAAYYLVHSMGDSKGNFENLEELCAKNFIAACKGKTKQIIFLSGITNVESLSPHLTSRKNVEEILIHGGIPYTVLKSAVIIGSGSASFEIIRDLTEKLPFMITPKWVNNKTQPVAITDVLFYLKAVLGNPKAMNQCFEIGGPQQLTYKEMLLGYAKIRGLKRYILNVPVLTPRLSSYWLYFVTSANFSLAKALVDSLHNVTVCKDFHIQTLIPHQCLSYDEAVSKALAKIEQNHVVSSWRDALNRSRIDPQLQQYIHVPTDGCLIDKQRIDSQKSPEALMKTIWAIGGQTGWYFANWAWALRGFGDKLVGGVGLNRGRTHPDRIEIGDALDFWRVLAADKNNNRLLLYAEMKVPGEAWLEFQVHDSPTGSGSTLEQTATFRPKGLLGRLYWYLLLPIHKYIFRGMAKAIVSIPEVGK